MFAKQNYSADIIEIASLPESIQDAMSRFDTDGNGTIDKRELELIFKELKNDESQVYIFIRVF